MNATPLITVIVVNYNYARYLGECIDSVIAQTYPNLEIIVVDDGSTDNSLNVLQAYGEKLRVLHQENKGVSAARNAGVFASRGEWIAFLDSDDTWQPEKVQKQSTYIQDSAVGMVFCGVEFMDDSGQCLGYTRPLLDSDLLPQLVTFTSPTVAGGSTAVVKSDCLRDLGGFDEKLSTAADLDMWTRIAAKHGIRAVNAPLVRYRRHSDSMQSNLGLFENDNYRFLTKVYSDPSCARVHHLRRQSFGKFYMILSGSYFRQGNWSRAIQCAIKALSYQPQQLSHIVGFPIRALRRLMTP